MKTRYLSLLMLACGEGPVEPATSPDHCIAPYEARYAEWDGGFTNVACSGGCSEDAGHLFCSFDPRGPGVPCTTLEEGNAICEENTGLPDPTMLVCLSQRWYRRDCAGGCSYTDGGQFVLCASH